jgi:ATP-grasp domain
MKPTVLIVTTLRWTPTARLAMALANAGFTVDAVCPTRHPFEKTGALRRKYPYRALMAVTSVADAIAGSKPDMVIPGDDLATSHLHELYRRGLRRGQAEKPICDLIERSLGSPQSFSFAQERSDFIELARAANVRAPKMEAIPNLDGLRKWIAQVGLPTVLKANGTSGGDGVRVVHTLKDAEAAFSALQAPPLFLRAAKRAVLDQDTTLLWPSALRRRSVVNAQEFVAGREATSAVACWKGAVLASLHFEVLNKRDSAGPSSVVRRIEHAEMTFAVETMVRELNLSGIYGFDFMLEAQPEHAHLIEINPRATQVGHLTLGAGCDLPAALYAAVTGGAVHPAPRLTENDTIALFPQEWLRDPASPFLQSGYHDVPWDEPELIRSCARKRHKKGEVEFQRTPLQNLSAVRLPRL